MTFVAFVGRGPGHAAPRAGLRVRLGYLVWLLFTVELAIFHRPFSVMSW